MITFLPQLSRRLRGELIVYWSSRRPSVRLSVCVSTLSNMNISETNGSIATRFYLKHHWGLGLAALGFGPDRIRTLVSMATESSHRVIMVKTVSPLFYTPGIYADGYIVFAFPFVRSSVRMFVSSFVRLWNLCQSFALKFLKWCISQQLLIRKHSYLDHSYP